jgi:hypothetical protein
LQDIQIRIDALGVFFQVVDEAVDDKVFVQVVQIGE